MTVTFYAIDTEFAAASGDNVNVSPEYSYFDHPPNSTQDLEITSNAGDDDPNLFEVGEAYDLIWSGHGGGNMDDAIIIRSDYVGPGEGAIVFEGTNSVTGELFQMIWTPNFNLEDWYWDNGGGPSSPNAFWTSDQNNGETYRVACFSEGTMIRTPTGICPVETLKEGQLVLTLDNGAQVVRWVQSATQDLSGLDTDQRPVLISKGALGENSPPKDLIVSPLHRVLVGGRSQLSMLFSKETFVPAKSLTRLRGVRHMNGKSEITWHHFACDKHELVWANGCLVETMLLGPMALQTLNLDERRQVSHRFGPEVLPGLALNGPPARICPTNAMIQTEISNQTHETRPRKTA